VIDRSTGKHRQTDNHTLIIYTMTYSHTCMLTYMHTPVYVYQIYWHALRIEKNTDEHTNIQSGRQAHMITYIHRAYIHTHIGIAD